jgi:predicted transcriptional regulator
LRKREPILIQMDILASLFESPKGHTRLAQACNVNYARIGNFTRPLLEKGLIVSRDDEGDSVLAISEEGYRLYRDWLEIWRRLRFD